MTTETDKALAVVGAVGDDLGKETGTTGTPAPAPPSNSPPADPVADKAAADKAAADAAAAKEVADAEAAKAKADAPAEDAELDTAVWGSTQDEVGDSVLALLQNSGIELTDAKAFVYDALQSGDATKLDRDALIEKVGKAKATLIIAGAENFITRTVTRSKEIMSDVHTAAGGEENWAALTAWAKGNVPDAELADYRALIDQGGIKARFATTDLLSRFNADTKNTTLSASAGEITADTKAAPQSRQTTKAEYVSELSAAHKRGADTATLNEIQKARERGRTAGI